MIEIDLLDKRKKDLLNRKNEILNTSLYSLFNFGEKKLLLIDSEIDEIDFKISVFSRLSFVLEILKKILICSEKIETPKNTKVISKGKKNG